ncbi:MAG: hypothetical protein A2885_14065 [Sphingopyxis sp. RIFCSPHIGHO2_01_FULL_65_24]|nr:MAG: hypothetical protein A2885_14065 [Sphingopyxis sp. RIFCSPHIGHO2_01_FULL_65_24]
MHASGALIGTTVAFSPKRSPARATPCWIVNSRSSAPISNHGPNAAMIFNPFFRSRSIRPQKSSSGKTRRPRSRNMFAPDHQPPRNFSQVRCDCG